MFTAGELAKSSLCEHLPSLVQSSIALQNLSYCFAKLTEVAFAEFAKQYLAKDGGIVCLKIRKLHLKIFNI